MKYNEEIFKKELYKLYKNDLKLISHFKSIAKPIILQDQFGLIQVSQARQALQGNPGILGALNKTQYFMNLLKFKYPDIAQSLEPQSEYKKMKDKMLFKTKFGIVAITPDALLHGHIPSIRSAVNRKEYFKNQLMYLYDNKYDFEITSTDRYKGKVTLICPIHGKQIIDSDGIFLGIGCPKCNKDIQSSNVFYLIQLFNENESFFKLGISHYKKNGKLSRFSDYKTLGYNIKVIKLITFKDALDCKEFELKLKQLIKPNLYKPKKWAAQVSTETFKDSFLNIILQEINNIKYDIVSTSNENQSSINDQD